MTVVSVCSTLILWGWLLHCGSLHGVQLARPHWLVHVIRCVPIRLCLSPTCRSGHPAPPAPGSGGQSTQSVCGTATRSCQNPASQQVVWWQGPMVVAHGHASTAPSRAWYPGWHRSLPRLYPPPSNGSTSGQRWACTGTVSARHRQPR